MFRWYAEIKEFIEELNHLFYLNKRADDLSNFISTGIDKNLISEKPIKNSRPTPHIELKEGLTGRQLSIAVELKAKEIVEKSKGTPTEYYEREALGMILDETNGYHIKPQIKRVNTICEYVGNGKTVLDCAGGGGYIANLIRNQGNDVTVMDYSKVHLLRAKWLRGLKTAHGRAESLPFPDHSFDVVIMAEVLEHCEKISVPLAEAERVCKEDGQIIITVPVCAKQDEYGEHLKSIRQTFIDDETHNNEMLVLSIKNILPHLKEFRDRGRGVSSTEAKDYGKIDRLGNIIVKGMHGLGDNIGQRNFIKEIGFPIYLETPWPQLYSDLPNVKLLPCNTYWRTQKKNLEVNKNKFKFHEYPEGNTIQLNVGYNNEALQGNGSIFKALSDTFGGVIPKTFDMPNFKSYAPMLPNVNKLAIIRPTIQRKEWFSTSRNPASQYIYRASQLLKEANYFIISVCDLEENLEWIEGEEPIADIKYHHGELRIESLLGLIQSADILVGSPGMLIHASLASKVPMAVIYGGYGGCNPPKK